MLALAHLLALPVLALWRFKPKYRHSLSARFFARGHKLTFKPVLWFHACSFGEIKSLEPLLALFPSTPILLTTTTQTGYTLAHNTYAHNAHIQVRYLLFETLLWLWRKDLNALQTLVVTEAELWLGVFMLAKKVGAQTFLINARISKRSYGRYYRFRAFYAYLFSKVDRIYAQSAQDLERLSSLGMRTGTIFPNLKLFNPPKPTHHYPKPPKTLILAASTHPGEEVLILEAFLALQSDALLCLAPRHPERFEEVKKILIQKDLIFDLFSEGLTWRNPITLIDALGVLNDFYAIADIVILGGAFAPIGGHNPLEPAFFGAKLISGTHIFNQEALFSCVQNYVLVEPPQLAQTLAQAQTILPSSIEYGDHRLETLAQALCKKPINS
ncbi:lipid IV(A) 3-deoxy-D-manno-octulosonic acid transferase [Helicobacter sp. L8]|uniref:lipid IV(A) 3-deoxy-D-manno-octulosonic acid transferase n=1 Tax=Helicobacter sp. L8 TaxID=2316078 RepID=UPI001F09807B|nr:lipid IV(A) 3-deoxy-D-manno-octulosonic acid transferase [Helicobacter sp. L8]